MDEYIKRKDVLTALDYIGFAPETDPIPLTLAAARKHVRRIPSADVVPSAEVERLQHILDCYALQYGTVKDQQSAIDKAKAEVEKEIGEEIYRIIGECHNETWVCLLIKEFADRLINGNKSNVETCIACVPRVGGCVRIARRKRNDRAEKVS